MLDIARHHCLSRVCRYTCVPFDDLIQVLGQELEFNAAHSYYFTEMMKESFHEEGLYKVQENNVGCEV